MMYAVLCYNDEQMVCGWSKEQDDQVMANLKEVHHKWEQSGKLKPSIRLLPTRAVRRSSSAEPKARNCWHTSAPPATQMLR